MKTMPDRFLLFSAQLAFSDARSSLHADESASDCTPADAGSLLASALSRLVPEPLVLLAAACASALSDGPESDATTDELRLAELTLADAAADYFAVWQARRHQQSEALARRAVEVQSTDEAQAKE